MEILVDGKPVEPRANGQIFLTAEQLRKIFNVSDVTIGAYGIFLIPRLE